MIVNFKAHSVQFGDSANDVLRYLDTAKRYGISNTGFGHATGIKVTTTYQEARRMVIEGWHEGVEMMHSALAAMYAPAPPALATRVYAEAGHYPDVGRFLSNDPRSMVRRKRAAGNRPVVHIVVNTALRMTVTEQQQINYGVGLAAAIDRIESSGRRVELDRVGVVTSLKRAGYRCVQGWKIKHAEDHMDLAAMVFALAHPASHRRLIWAMRTCNPAFGDDMGCPEEVSIQDVALIGAREDCVRIDGVLGDGHRCNTPAEALKLVVERLNRAAGETLVTLED